MVMMMRLVLRVRITTSSSNSNATTHRHAHKQLCDHRECTFTFGACRPPPSPLISMFTSVRKASAIRLRYKHTFMLAGLGYQCHSFEIRGAYVDGLLLPQRERLLRHIYIYICIHRQDESFDTFLAHAGKGRGVKLTYSTPRGAEENYLL